MWSSTLMIGGISVRLAADGSVGTVSLVIMSWSGLQRFLTVRQILERS